MRIFFTIDGVPIAKGRPRFARTRNGIANFGDVQVHPLRLGRIPSWSCVLEVVA